MSYKDKIVRHDNFKPSEETVKFGQATPNKSGQGKSSRLTYNNKPLVLQTRKLRNPFGFSRGIEGTDSYNKKFSCTISFDVSTAKGKGFLDQMVALQDLVAKEAYENRVAWGLGTNPKKSKAMTAEAVRDKMTPIVRIPTDKEGNEISDYPPTFRVTFLTRTEGEELMITSEVWNEKKEAVTQIDETTIRPGSSCKVLMTAGSVWITPNGYGINFRIKQIMVYPGDGLPTGRCLIEDDDDSDDDEVTPAAASGNIKLSLRNTTSNDDDDAEEEEE